LTCRALPASSESLLVFIHRRGESLEEELYTELHLELFFSILEGVNNPLQWVPSSFFAHELLVRALEGPQVGCLNGQFHLHPLELAVLPEPFEQLHAQEECCH
jgi:hypothetical protein